MDPTDFGFEPGECPGAAEAWFLFFHVRCFCMSLHGVRLQVPSRIAPGLGGGAALGCKTLLHEAKHCEEDPSHPTSTDVASRPWLAVGESYLGGGWFASCRTVGPLKETGPTGRMLQFEGRQTTQIPQVPERAEAATGCLCGRCTESVCFCGYVVLGRNTHDACS